MKVYVILPVHNRWVFTHQFLESLGKQNLPPGVRTHLVIVDDGSSDETARRLKDLHDVTVISGDGHLWWAGSVKRALGWIRPRLDEDDCVYLGNNDTVLDPRHIALLVTEHREGGIDLAGSVSFEVWPSGEHHPVTTAFTIESRTLDVSNIPMEALSSSRIDALAGRGLLLSSRAAHALTLHPRAMPQHFADIAATSRLIAAGFSANVQMRATSVQLARAGSSVELKPSVASVLSRRGSLYLPAITTFWWQQLSPADRISLAWRFPARALRQSMRGRYTLGQRDR